MTDKSPAKNTTAKEEKPIEHAPVSTPADKPTEAKSPEKSQVKPSAAEPSVDDEAVRRRNMLKELRDNNQTGTKRVAARKVSDGDTPAAGGGDRPALRKLLAKRRAKAGDGEAAGAGGGGGGQNRGQLLQLLAKRRRGQGGAGEDPGVDENSSPDEISAHRERLESRAGRLERALKGVMAEIDETRDLEQRAIDRESADSSD